MLSWLHPVSETTNTQMHVCSSRLGWLFQERFYEYWLEVYQRAGLRNQSSLSTRFRLSRRRTKRRKPIRNCSSCCEGSCSLRTPRSNSTDCVVVKEKAPENRGLFLLLSSFVVEVVELIEFERSSLRRSTEVVIIDSLWW